jgi:hypothetical protein
VILVAVLAAATVPLQAAEAPPLDARTAALRMNQDVTFEDVVHAAAASSSGRHGTYLSFGAPYPDQVLTVNIPQEFQMWRRDLGRLLHRRVRVTGRVETSATGPRITLKSPEQLVLLPVDEALLGPAGRALEGKTDRRLFAVAVQQVFLRGELDRLDALASELRSSKARFRDGSWKLPVFYEAFAIPRNSSQETWETAARQLEEWERRFPQSPTPVIAKAAFRNELAWQWRDGRETTTDRETRKAAVKERVKEAHDILAARPDAAVCPHYRLILLQIAMQEEWPADRYMQLFAQASAAEPEYYEYYFEIVRYLLPRWRGKPGDWERFAEQQRERLGGDRGAELYTRLARAQEPYYDRLFRDTQLRWEQVAEGFDAMLRRYPDSRYNRNSYAMFCFFARDKERLREMLRQIGSDLDMNVWATRANVNQAREFAAAP